MKKAPLKTDENIDISKVLEGVIQNDKFYRVYIVATRDKFLNIHLIICKKSFIIFSYREKSFICSTLK